MIMPSKKVFGILIIILSFIVFIMTTFGRKTINTKIIPINTLIPGQKFKLPENLDWQNEIKKIDADENLSTNTEKENVTDTLSRTFMYNYLALKQNNSLNETSADDLIQQLYNYTSEIPLKNIASSDLKIIKDNGLETITDYGEKLGFILKTNRPTKPLNELQIIDEALNTQSPERIEDLQDLIDIYGNIANEMTKMQVPESFIKAHIDMNNGILEVEGGLKEIKEVFNDPIRGINGIAMYQSGRDKFIQSTIAIVEFIKNNKIFYKQGSGGYYLLYGI